MNRANESNGQQRVSRRRLFSLVAAGFGGATATLVSIPILGFIVAPSRRRQEERWYAVGETSAFSVGETVKVEIPDGASVPWSGREGESAIWLRRSDEQTFRAFSLYCTHLGCPVLWMPSARLFLCPCHGGTFHEEGQVASGPPDRALDEYEVRVEGDQVEVRTRGVEIE